jgi:hypothetical protein
VVREVGKFWRLERSENLGGRKVWKDLEGGSFSRILSPIIIAILPLRVDCVSYHSGDYRTERLVHSITVVLHVVQIHINVSIYYSVVYHVRILDKNLSGTRTRLPRFHLIGTTGIGTIGTSERLGGYGDRTVLGIRKVKSFERLGRSDILGG